ncbi:uncharacterized protein LOC131434693 [Malaya genurostris]|uniref:uncharacterized protein LOC131434693 n=1 Tax=Malaya genurostris TaxID=325434 RepID=UPI0026F40121|nr:uncharacterized protein LOC131434693 [Malaya genurostris]
MNEERNLSEFLYHLSREIVTSRDFSDCNINRICSKYYNHSNYPDKERLCKLVENLKRKLLMYNCEDTGEISTQAWTPRTKTSLQTHCSSTCVEDHYSPYPRDEKFIDKCVGTHSSPFISKQMVNHGTQHFEPVSVQSASTAALASYPTNSYVLQQKKSSSKHDSPPSSDVSDMLIEQILMKHAAMADETSSEILMRMAAADRVLCETCKGQCPLHRCNHFRNEPQGPSTSSGQARREDTLSEPCNCPLKNCKHITNPSGIDGGGGGCGGCASDLPILRQEPAESATPPATCCGRQKKKKRKPSSSRRTGHTCKK